MKECERRESQATWEIGKCPSESVSVSPAIIHSTAPTGLSHALCCNDTLKTFDCDSYQRVRPAVMCVDHPCMMARYSPAEAARRGEELLDITFLVIEARLYSRASLITLPCDLKIFMMMTEVSDFALITVRRFP